MRRAEGGGAQWSGPAVTLRTQGRLHRLAEDRGDPTFDPWTGDPSEDGQESYDQQARLSVLFLLAIMFSLEELKKSGLVPVSLREGYKAVQEAHSVVAHSSCREP